MINDELKTKIESEFDSKVIQAKDVKSDKEDLIITLDRPSDNPLAANNEVLKLSDMDTKITSHCRDGFCGACQCKLLDGVVAQSNDAIAHVNEGNFLACKAKILSRNIRFESNQPFK